MPGKAVNNIRRQNAGSSRGFFIKDPFCLTLVAQNRVQLYRLRHLSVFVLYVSGARWPIACLNKGVAGKSDPSANDFLVGFYVRDVCFSDYFRTLSLAEHLKTVIGSDTLMCQIF